MRLLHPVVAALALLSGVARAEPNIIVVFADDLALGGVEAYGQVIGGLGAAYSTPSLDQLAADGMRFTNALAVTPLCAPARAALYTGKYPNGNGLFKNSDPEEFSWVQQTIPGLLQDSAAGYDTWLIGKNHGMGTDGTPPVGDPWDSYALLTTEQGTYDNPTFFECDAGDPESCRSTAIQHTGGTCVSLADYGDDSDCYFTDELTRMAINKIDARTAQPFFLVMSHKATHGQWVPPIRHQGTLAAQSPSQPATYGDDRTGRVVQVQEYSNLSFPGQYNTWTGASYQNARPTGMGKEAPPGGTPTDAEKKDWVTEQYQEDYLETALGIEDSVTTLRAYLVAEGIAANTVIIVLSDNGMHVADHGLTNKSTSYQESVRIPLIMACASGTSCGINAAQVKTEYVLNVDVSATILDLANVTPAEAIHGRSLLELQGTPDPAWRTAVLLWGPWKLGAAQEAGVAPWYGLLTATDLLVQHFTAQDGNTPVWEFADFASNPNELTNQYGDAGFFSTIQTRKASLRQALSDVGIPTWADGKATQ